MILSDQHMHSFFSPDSQSDLTQIAEKAISLGLKEITITDHYELEADGLSLSTPDSIETYVNAVLDLQTKYKNQLAIHLGAELGLQENRDFTSLLKDYPFDFFLGSIHRINNIGVSRKEFWQGRSEAETYHDFFQQENRYFAQNKLFNVAGHIDYITRYPYRWIEDVKGLDLDAHWEEITAILTTLISNNKGIEINTSGFRYNENRVYPHTKILKLYKKLGGEILTIGSDAHTIEDTATQFNYAEHCAKEGGFDYYTTFKQQKPSWHKF